MGSGNLMKELDRFVQRVATSIRWLDSSWPPRFSTVMRAVIEELGTRSSRHVYNRGNLLLLDLLFRLSNDTQPCDVSATAAV